MLRAQRPGRASMRRNNLSPRAGRVYSRVLHAGAVSGVRPIRFLRRVTSGGPRRLSRITRYGVRSLKGFGKGGLK